MNKFFLAARPKTLIASVSPVVIATAMVLKKGMFTPWIFLFTLLTAVGIQISTNFANDLFDYLKGADNALRKGPIRITASGLISVERMKWATAAVLFSTAACGSVLIYQGGVVIAALVALALVFALGYTAGPFPIAYLGLGEVCVLIFFGPIATLSTYYLQTKQLCLAPFLAGFGPGLLSCSLLIVNNIRDIDEDRAANKMTLACRWGKTFGLWEYRLSVLGAFCIPLVFISKNALASLTCLGIIPAYCLARWVDKIQEPQHYNLALANTGKLLGLYTLTFFLLWIA